MSSLACVRLFPDITYHMRTYPRGEARFTNHTGPIHDYIEDFAVDLRDFFFFFTVNLILKDMFTCIFTCVWEVMKSRTKKKKKISQKISPKTLKQAICTHVTVQIVRGGYDAAKWCVCVSIFLYSSASAARLQYVRSAIGYITPVILYSQMF